MSRQKIVWECSACGNQQPYWTGNCNQCRSWNTFIESVVEKVAKNKNSSIGIAQKPVKISDISSTKVVRTQTNIKELDRLLGGGVVPGSLLLVGGAPGIGKSTLLLKLADGFALQGYRVLYVCAEESVEQTSIRAKRLELCEENIYLYNETNFQSIQTEIQKNKPDIFILDSIQVIYNPDLPASAGSVVQVREIASACMHLAKGLKISTFLIGHVTKSGEIAGPRVLEHLVDTVLEFEGDKQHGYRLLRSIKNRFGPTDDIAIFQMQEKGLQEIVNPSEVFLEHRQEKIAGCVTTATLEGLRSFLIEVQSLVTHSVYPTPTRRCAGLDQNRLALLLAVLEKKMRYQLYKFDVFVSIAGGMRIQEPAVDLAVLMAIASSYANRAIDPHTIVIGEVGLAGEVRAVLRMENRIKEAIHMGFTRCIIPQRNAQEIEKKYISKIEIIGVSLVEDAIRKMLV